MTEDEMFAQVMDLTEQIVNEQIRQSPEDFYSISSTEGEVIIADATREAIGKLNEPVFVSDDVKHVGGSSFPDVTAKVRHGVEVKTRFNSWKTAGSSIAEGNRISGVEDIYLAFIRTGDNPECRIRPYAECMEEIGVTHSPRFKINMEAEESIFDKMKITYEDFSHDENRIKYWTDYVKKNLRKGQQLWWLSSTDSDEVIPAHLTFFSKLSKQQKHDIKMEALSLYPEIFAGKYERVTMWLATKGIVASTIRDQFTAGGKITTVIDEKEMVLPHIFSFLLNDRENIEHYILNANEEALMSSWEEEHIQVGPQRIEQWSSLVIKNISASETYRKAAKHILK